MDSYHEYFLEDRPFISTLKSEEEIVRHTVEENLTDVQKAIVLLDLGDELQQMSVMQSLPLLVEANPESCLQEIIPRVQQALPNANPELHLVASNSFLTILKKELVPQTTFTQTFLQSILSSIDSKDPVVANAWLETLLDVIDLLPSDVIRQQVLPVAVGKGQLSQPVASRLASCKLLGKIAGKFDPFLIQKDILPVAQSLCQDVNYEVRACMCQQLDAISRGVGPEATRTSILQQLVELANDEEVQVRIAAIVTVVNLLGMLDSETYSETIIPLIKKLCTVSIKAEDQVLIVIAKELGKLCHGLSGNLSSAEKSWFVDFYKDLATLGLSSGKRETLKTDLAPMPDLVPVIDNADRCAECRHYCAYNFPAMLIFCGGAEQFQESLYTTFHNLVNDPYFYVRRTMATGFHEVVVLLGSKVTAIKGDLIHLLNDNTVEVLEGIIPNLTKSLEVFSAEGAMGGETAANYLVELCDALLHCETEVAATYNWRLHVDVLEKMACVSQLFASDLVHETFTPVLRHKVHCLRPLPCRMAAAKTLLVVMRYNQQSQNRENIYQFFKEELAHGYSCHSRMMFIYVCNMVIELFSKSFFKKKFFTSLLDLADDPVPNIRLKLCTILPQMKAVLKMPGDNNLLQQLEACVRKLMAHEKERDVSAGLRTAISELDKIEVSIETFPASVGSFHDIEDLKKLEEELRLAGKDDLVQFSSANHGGDNSDKNQASEKPVRKKIGAQSNITSNATSGYTKMEAAMFGKNFGATGTSISPSTRPTAKMNFIKKPFAGSVTSKISQLPSKNVVGSTITSKSVPKTNLQRQLNDLRSDGFVSLQTMGTMASRLQGQANKSSELPRPFPSLSSASLVTSTTTSQSWVWPSPSLAMHAPDRGLSLPVDLLKGSGQEVPSWCSESVERSINTWPQKSGSNTGGGISVTNVPCGSDPNLVASDPNYSAYYGVPSTAEGLLYYQRMKLLASSHSESHHHSMPSVFSLHTNMDPTADEFYIDAGVRICATQIKPPVSRPFSYLHDSILRNSALLKQKEEEGTPLECRFSLSQPEISLNTGGELGLRTQESSYLSCTPYDTSSVSSNMHVTHQVKSHSSLSSSFSEVNLREVSEGRSRLKFPTRFASGDWSDSLSLPPSKLQLGNRKSLTSSMSLDLKAEGEELPSSSQSPGGFQRMKQTRPTSMLLPQRRFSGLKSLSDENLEVPSGVVMRKPMRPASSTQSRSGIPRSVRNSRASSCHSSPGSSRSSSPGFENGSLKWRPSTSHPPPSSHHRRTVHSCNSSPVHSRGSSPTRILEQDEFNMDSGANATSSRFLSSWVTSPVSSKFSSRLPRSMSRASPGSCHSSPGNSRHSSPGSSRSSSPGGGDGRNSVRLGHLMTGFGLGMNGGRAQHGKDVTGGTTNRPGMTLTSGMGASKLPTPNAVKNKPSHAKK